MGPEPMSPEPERVHCPCRKRLPVDVGGSDVLVTGICRGCGRRYVVRRTDGRLVVEVLPSGGST